MHFSQTWKWIGFLSSCNCQDEDKVVEDKTINLCLNIVMFLIDSLAMHIPKDYSLRFKAIIYADYYEETLSLNTI